MPIPSNQLALGSSSNFEHLIPTISHYLENGALGRTREKLTAYALLLVAIMTTALAKKGV